MRKRGMTGSQRVSPRRALSPPDIWSENCLSPQCNRSVLYSRENSTTRKDSKEQSELSFHHRGEKTKYSYEQSMKPISVSSRWVPAKERAGLMSYWYKGVLPAWTEGHSFQFTKTKKVTHHDLEMVEKKKMPHALKYCSKLEDWSKTGRSFSFNRKKRETVLGEISRQKKRIPGPGTYKDRKEKSKGGLITNKGEAASCITDAEFLGKATPGFKYSNITYRTNSPSHAIGNARWLSTSNKRDRRPHYFNVKHLKLLQKQYPKLSFSRTKRTTYVKQEVKKKSEVPPVGHYKGVETGIDKLHRPYTKSGRR